MNKRQKNVSKDLLKNIEKAKTEEMRAEAVRTYSVFMNEVREQERHEDHQAKRLREALEKIGLSSTLSSVLAHGSRSENFGRSECFSHSYSE